MSCDCAELGVSVRSDTTSLPSGHMVCVAIDRPARRKLYACKCCNQFWIVDEWAHNQIGLAIKTSSRREWKKFNDRPIRLSHLVRENGGLSDEICTWAYCEYRAIKGHSYCSHHALRVYGFRT